MKAKSKKVKVKGHKRKGATVSAHTRKGKKAGKKVATLNIQTPGNGKSGDSDDMNQSCK